LNAVAALAVAAFLARRATVPGLRALTLTLIMLAVWSFGYAMITLSPSLEEKKDWLRIENIGILTLPSLWLIFTVRYTRLDRWLNVFTVALLFVIPAISLALIFSDRWFSL